MYIPDFDYHTPATVDEACGILASLVGLAGYLIPVDNTLLVEWASRQGFRQEPLKRVSRFRIEQYLVGAVDSIDFEGDRVVDPALTVVELKKLPSGPGYIFFPTNQLKGYLLVLALEPKSMLGLATYKPFAHLLQPGEVFPVLRVIKKPKLR